MCRLLIGGSQAVGWGNFSAQLPPDYACRFQVLLSGRRAWHVLLVAVLAEVPPAPRRFVAVPLLRRLREGHVALETGSRALGQYPEQLLQQMGYYRR